jgi:isoleucyl-tRNA synthetase
MIENFVVEDLSQWYIRRSREKFQKPESKKELEGASKTLGFVLLTLSKITAPFIPLLSEHIYRGLKPDVESSVHLEDWPKVKEKWIKKDLNEKMDLTRKIVGLGLELRAKAKIKVRQPLNNLQLTTHNLQDEFVNLIKEELNIKEVEIVKEIREGKDWILAGEEGIKIALNVEITLQLKEEGMVREFIRQIQGIRKKAGLKPKDKIIVQFSGRDELNKILIKNKKLILEKVKAKDLLLNKKPKISLNIEREIEINQEKLSIGIKVSNRKRRR